MSWNELIDILKDQKEADDGPPVACPNDGEPLQVAPDGALFCPFDGWTDDGIGRTA